MINPKECRVGNKLLFNLNKGQEQIVTVALVSDDSIGYLEQHEASYPQPQRLFYGIHLTPEMLVKCGFITEKITTTTLFNHPNCSALTSSIINNFTLEDGIVVDGYMNFMYIDARCFYLHQLQNLYFALTGTELEINL